MKSALSAENTSCGERKLRILRGRWFSECSMAEQGYRACLGLLAQW